MNFFERQLEVRRASARLVWLFALAVLIIVAFVDLAVWVAFRLGHRPTGVAVRVLVAAGLLTVLVIGLTSWIRTLLLRRGGGGKVAVALGGVVVPPDTAAPGLRRLRNVVEEIAIASGMPVPQLYVLPHEPGINAFAAGWTPANAAIVVTGGALARLNRDELQGVVAHEFSHIVNGDMRLNIRLMGVLAGIVGLAVLGRMLLSGRGSRRQAGPLVLPALAAVAAGYAGVLIGRLIKAGVSRQREFLADASAVQFTRQTAGLAGALKKIGGVPAGSRLHAAKAEDVSHMLFGEGRKSLPLFATHPPLERRIQLLDPAFDVRELDELGARWTAVPPSGTDEDRALGLAGPAAPVAVPASVAAPPATVVASIGNPASGSFGHAGGLLRGIPEDVQAQARRAETVVPLVLGLLLSAQPHMRTAQYRLLAARLGTPLADAAWREGERLRGLDPALRLPLTELAFPALSGRPAHELHAVQAVLSEVVRLDGNVDTFEYCLSTLLSRDLHEAVHHRPPWPVRRIALPHAGPAVAALFAVVAAVGHREQAAAEAAFRAGLSRVVLVATVPFQPPAQAWQALDGVWPVLDGLAGPDKALVVEGLTTVIGNDGVVGVAESELLRTVCAMLHCPLPPLMTVGVSHQPLPPRT
ncbi:M48 family metallopeptidase [Amycolatopsis granulosa]|uniref:M48 family metallopeptidase n=1 Tax=Amycolatopsis granulosa TaxID=185684 RepID=UPI00141FD282|nr:M48 family metallopeptidase [Amycolatopsis granulosa]NIH85384.1 Zn-dependent protease with chaperone function [Amycolatopsis granulosa]